MAKLASEGFILSKTVLSAVLLSISILDWFPDDLNIHFILLN
jgi:hypothetical protein